jgi:hypothetical protein
MVGRRKQHRIIDDLRLQAEQDIRKRLRKKGLLLTKLRGKGK